eukprot:CAMPEP_0172422742 /NCGR_PEP_ID=MMETSP1064-20121228/8873_1 /TAXON_ID=202472 /ORGANISM="Aulacoseira subarctica , Strain CCAP 1002/5" /LENGTH=662 /DNA_ID=CAMNT_0013163761 /DNA_START=69 /DNA_END=2057 /DNA_ORIENTATION=+
MESNNSVGTSSETMDEPLPSSNGSKILPNPLMATTNNSNGAGVKSNSDFSSTLVIVDDPLRQVVSTKISHLSQQQQQQQEESNNNIDNHNSNNVYAVAMDTSKSLLSSLVHGNNEEDTTVLFSGISLEEYESTLDETKMNTNNTDSVGSNNIHTSNPSWMSMSAPPEFFYRNHDTTGFISGKQQQKRDNGNLFLDPLLSFTKTDNADDNTTPVIPMQNISSTNYGKEQSITSISPKNPTVQESTYCSTFIPLFSSVSVTDPRLMSVTNSGFFSPLTGSSYWVYTVSSTTAATNKTIHVQRRFRHFDALQDRLREACPGSILPSRPGKHSTDARQSPAFASQRAKELHQYLNALIQHPQAGKSDVLAFFLTFLDPDLGTAWSEVSSSALTRFASAASWSTNTTNSETAAAVAGLNEWPATTLSFDYTPPTGTNNTPLMEDNMEIVRMCNMEHVRIECISQAVPKIDKLTCLLQELSDKSETLTVELSKLSKDLLCKEDVPLCSSVDIFTSAMLRISTIQRRLSIEVKASMDPFLQEIRQCRMERAAFQDRREAFIKWWTLQSKAEQKSQKIQIYKQNGIAVQRSKFEAELAFSQSMASEALDQLEKIGSTLQSEVIRLRQSRQKEWRSGIKIMAANMKEAHTEQKCIWEEAKENLLRQTFPKY